jgi:hypothetical protein
MKEPGEPRRGPPGENMFRNAALNGGTWNRPDERVDHTPARTDSTRQRANI